MNLTAVIPPTPPTTGKPVRVRVHLSTTGTRTLCGRPVTEWWIVHHSFAHIPTGRFCSCCLERRPA